MSALNVRDLLRQPAPDVLSAGIGFAANYVIGKRQNKPAPAAPPAAVVEKPTPVDPKRDANAALVANLSTPHAEVLASKLQKEVPKLPIAEVVSSDSDSDSEGAGVELTDSLSTPAVTVPKEEPKLIAQTEEVKPEVASLKSDSERAPVAVETATDAAIPARVEEGSSGQGNPGGVIETAEITANDEALVRALQEDEENKVEKPVERLRVDAKAELKQDLKLAAKGKKDAKSVVETDSRKRKHHSHHHSHHRSHHKKH